MVSYLKAAAITFVALFALVLSLNVKTARAEDKKGCELCAEVKVVLGSLRCEKCKPDKQCEKCEAHVKEMTEKLACKGCKDKACADCETALKANKCKFCAAKHYVVTHIFCCEKCEKAGNEKAEKCDHCKEARAMVEKLECKEKDCPNKKK